MDMTPTTVGAYLRDLPPDRRVAMARVCSMIRRSARGVRESMRYGLAFYELDGPLFALESGKRHMSLYVAEQEVVVKHKDALTGVDIKRSFIKFSDLNRLPLDVVENDWCSYADHFAHPVSSFVPPCVVFWFPSRVDQRAAVLETAAARRTDLESVS